LILNVAFVENGSAVLIPVNFADGISVYKPVFGFSLFFSSSGKPPFDGLSTAATPPRADVVGGFPIDDLVVGFEVEGFGNGGGGAGPRPDVPTCFVPGPVPGFGILIGRDVVVAFFGCVPTFIAVCCC
jgi:hypothetical protein